jgi:hypothetical protein
VTKNICTLLRRHPTVNEVIVTTRTIEKDMTLHGKKVLVYPCAAYCYLLGRNITARLDIPMARTPEQETDKIE